MTIESCLRLRYRGLHRHLTLAVFRRYYEEFAASYRKGLRAAEARGEIRKGDAEVHAWALMGISDMVGRRFALWDGKTRLKRVADAAFELVAKGLAPNSD